nr:STAS domain-containing protein [Pseudoduganella aquatica]
MFSLFKKGKPDAAATDGDDDAARLAANSEAQRAAANSQLQRDIARATALKIDAIEAAMEADIFNTPEPAWGSRPARPVLNAAPAPADNPATLPLLDASTTQLLADDEIPAPVADSATAPVVEESAILYANGQAAVAEQMLAGALAEAAAAGLGAQQDRTVWWLLFDLHQAQGQQEQFDSLSIDYASTFETSPPPWRGAGGAAAAPAAAPSGAPGASYAGVAPTQVFGAVLDAGAAAVIARVEAACAADAAVPLRLDFSAIASADAEGCALLLAALRSLQKQGRELIVVAAAELAALLQGRLTVGDRADGEAPWLLLLELLQLLNREKDFEEASMDYCVTFEVSPPPFVAPSKVATAARAAVPAAAAGKAADRFMLPAVVEGNCTALLDAVGAYAEQYPALVFDCSRLARLDFGAANLLLSRLQQLAADGRRVEFREVNHLVAALLRLLGYAGVARIFAHKY